MFKQLFIPCFYFIFQTLRYKTSLFNTLDVINFLLSVNTGKILLIAVKLLKSLTWQQGLIRGTK